MCVSRVVCVSPLVSFPLSSAESHRLQEDSVRIYLVLITLLVSGLDCSAVECGALSLSA